MAWLDSDSSVVYYDMASGLVAPEAPEEQEMKSERRKLYKQRRKKRITR